MEVVMYLKHVPSGDLVEVVDLSGVIDPSSSTIRARSYAEDVPHRPEYFLKTELIFPSGEPLPLCWLKNHYHEHAAA
jgi:hypothetical protein